MNPTIPETAGITGRQIDKSTEPQAKGFSTNELASAIRISPATLRVQLCTKGSYFGLRPERLPNGRLLWPADSLERLKEAGRKTPTPKVGRKRHEAVVVAP